MTRQTTPRVSILTAVRDAIATIDEAVESIRAQDLADWQWVCVDDGSTDGTSDRLEVWARRDPRLQVLHRPATGLPAALNTGLRQCQAPLVARMDADDVSLPERLTLQVAAFAAYPEVTVIDGRVQLFGGERNQGMDQYVEWVNHHSDHRSIADDLFVESPLVHPAVCYRREPVLAAGGYAVGDFPEDYELWLRLHARGSTFLKLPQTILRWRDRPDRLTRTDPRYRTAAFTALKQEFLWQIDGQALSRGPFVLWGASRSTRSWRQWLRRHDVRPTFVVDANPARLGQRILQAPVVQDRELRRRSWTYLLVTVSSPSSRQEIRRRLAGWGLDGTNRRIRFV